MLTIFEHRIAIVVTISILLFLVCAAFAFSKLYREQQSKVNATLTDNTSQVAAMASKMAELVVSLKQDERFFSSHRIDILDAQTGTIHKSDERQNYEIQMENLRKEIDKRELEVRDLQTENKLINNIISEKEDENAKLVVEILKSMPLQISQVSSGFQEKDYRADESQNPIVIANCDPLGMTKDEAHTPDSEACKKLSVFDNNTLEYLNRAKVNLNEFKDLFKDLIDVSNSSVEENSKNKETAMLNFNAKFKAESDRLHILRLKNIIAGQAKIINKVYRKLSEAQTKNTSKNEVNAPGSLFPTKDMEIQLLKIKLRESEDEVIRLQDLVANRENEILSLSVSLGNKDLLIAKEEEKVEKLNSNLEDLKKDFKTAVKLGRNYS